MSKPPNKRQSAPGDSDFELPPAAAFRPLADRFPRRLSVSLAPLVERWRDEADRGKGQPRPEVGTVLEFADGSSLMACFLSASGESTTARLRVFDARMTWGTLASLDLSAGTVWDKGTLTTLSPSSEGLEWSVEVPLEELRDENRLFAFNAVRELKLDGRAEAKPDDECVAKVGHVAASKGSLMATVAQLTIDGLIVGRVEGGGKLTGLRVLLPKEGVAVGTTVIVELIPKTQKGRGACVAEAVLPRRYFIREVFLHKSSGRPMVELALTAAELATIDSFRIHPAPESPFRPSGA